MSQVAKMNDFFRNFRETPESPINKGISTFSLNTSANHHLDTPSHATQINTPSVASRRPNSHFQDSVTSLKSECTDQEARPSRFDSISTKDDIVLSLISTEVASLIV